MYPFRHNTGVWQTDRRIDILPRHSPRYAYASGGKNPQHFLSPAFFMSCNFMPSDLVRQFQVVRFHTASVILMSCIFSHPVPRLQACPWVPVKHTFWGFRGKLGLNKKNFENTLQVFFRQDMACVSWPNLIKIGRWKVNEMSSRFDDKKRLRRIRPSPPPPFCLHYADRTQNILSVVAPWPVQATKFGPHRLWFAGVIFFFRKLNFRIVKVITIWKTTVI